MRMSALFDAKNLRFFRNLTCVCTDKEGVGPVRTSGGRDSIFAILCGRLLWMDLLCGPQII